MLNFYGFAGQFPAIGWWRQKRFGLILDEVPFITLLLITSLIYIEGVPGFRWLVWGARALLGCGLLIWFFKTRRQLNVTVNIPLLFWAFVAYSVSSAFWAVSHEPILAISSDLLTLCLFFFMAMNVVNTQLRLQQLLALVNTITFIFAVIAIVKAGLGVQRPGVFPTQDPNVLGFYFLFAIGLQLSLIMAGWRCRYFWPNLLMMLTNLLGLMMTQSRGDFIGFVVMFGVLFLFGSVSKRWLIFTVLAFGMFFLFPPGAALWERFTSLAFDHGSKRLDIWLLAWQMIKDHLWFGVGLSNFPVLIGSYRSAANSTVIVNPGTGVHNSIFGVWSELGLVGLGFFLFLLGTAINHGRKLLQRFTVNSDEYLTAKGLMVATIGMFTASLFLGAYFRKYFWLPFVLMETLYYFRYNSQDQSVEMETER